MTTLDISSEEGLAILKAFVERLARALVDEPDRVEVIEIVGGMTVIYEISVAQGDVGKIVGRAGRNLAALRTLVTAVGAKLGRKTVLELIEPR